MTTQQQHPGALVPDVNAALAVLTEQVQIPPVLVERVVREAVLVLEIATLDRQIHNIAAWLNA